MKPMIIQRCANGWIIGPLGDDGALLPSAASVFQDGQEYSITQFLKQASEPPAAPAAPTREELQKVADVLADQAPAVAVES